LIYDLKEYITRFFQSRLLVLGTCMFLLFAILLGRVYSLQIINGKEYQDNFVMKIQKTLATDAARGNIYDCSVFIQSVYSYVYYGVYRGIS
jgi:penicillin-binding protein 2